MSTGNMLDVQPLELKFPRECAKQTSCAVQLTNKTNHYVAFKVKTTNPVKYSVRPNSGVLTPGSTCDLTITMQARKDIPPDFQCKDKFLVLSFAAKEGATTNDIDAEMFNKEHGKVVEEAKLTVAYIPTNPPNSAPGESEEGLTPTSLSPSSFMEIGNQSSSPFDSACSVSTLVVENAKLGKTITSLEKLVEELRYGYEKISTELMNNEALIEVFSKDTEDELEKFDLSLQVFFWRNRYEKMEAENKLPRQKITQLMKGA